MKNSLEVTIENLDLAQISQSGQCFRMWEKEKSTFCLVAFGKYLEVRQNGQTFLFSSSEEEYRTIWRPYFDLDTDYGYFAKSVDREDHYLREAAAFGSGIRILRQELWEILVTFIISQQNNIPRIRKCVENLCRKYGEPAIDGNGEGFYKFPGPDALAKAGEEELRDCNLGYRSRYIANTAAKIASGAFSLEGLKDMDYENAKKALMELDGVGIKVAECICLFALHRIEAFPVDTHIRQVLAQHYPQGFPLQKYPGYAGIMQQYIFYYDLHGTDRSERVQLKNQPR